MLSVTGYDGGVLVRLTMTVRITPQDLTGSTALGSFDSIKIAINPVPKAPALIGTPNRTCSTRYQTQLSQRTGQGLALAQRNGLLRIALKGDRFVLWD